MPSFSPASCVSFHCAAKIGLLMLSSVATRDIFRSACSTSKRLPVSSVTKELSPVTLPPGCARLATIPRPSGSPIAAMTIGIVRVALAAVSAAGVPRVRIRSTFARTNSSASAAKRSACPSPDR